MNSQHGWGGGVCMRAGAFDCRVDAEIMSAPPYEALHRSHLPTYTRIRTHTRAGLVGLQESFPPLALFTVSEAGALGRPSFRCMIKRVAPAVVKQLEFLPHYHGNLISGIMRY